MQTLMLDPVGAAWRALGAPVPMVRWRGPGVCDRCHTDVEQLANVRDVVSDKFTGWDAYAGVSTPTWCPACVWAHTEGELRHYPLVVTPESADRGTPEVLAAALGAPIGPDVAVIVPVTRKKHVLPRARWGTVTADDLTIGWGPVEVERLTVLRTLRDRGFSEAALAEDKPRWEVLRTLEPSVLADTLTAWPLLQSWREQPHVLAVALRATREIR